MYFDTASFNEVQKKYIFLFHNDLINWLVPVYYYFIKEFCKLQYFSSRKKNLSSNESIPQHV